MANSITPKRPSELNTLSLGTQLWVPADNTETVGKINLGAIIGTGEMGTTATTLRGAIREILQDMAAIKQVRHTGTVEPIAANTATTGTFTLTPPDGYTRPLGIVGYTLSGGSSTFLNVFRMFLTGDGPYTVAYGLRNTATAATEAITVYAYVLWSKV